MFPIAQFPMTEGERTMKNRVLFGGGLLLLAMLLMAVSVGRARQRVRWVAVANAKNMVGGAFKCLSYYFYCSL